MFNAQVNTIIFLFYIVIKALAGLEYIRIPTQTTLITTYSCKYRNILLLKFDVSLCCNLKCEILEPR